MKIFISHADDDKVKYDNLTYALRQAGLGTWDVASLRAGEPLEVQLRSAIEQCQACVFLGTKRSVESKWCLAELGAFWGAGTKVVIYLDDQGLLEPDLPPQFKGNLWTRSIESVVTALKELRRIPGGRERCIPAIEGHRLFQHAGYYPIDIGDNNCPTPNREVFGKAIAHLLEGHDPLAAMDLVYLRVDNLLHMPDLLLDKYLSSYETLLDTYSLRPFIQNFGAEKERVFRNYIRLVNDIGETLRDAYFEILLHDVRNPLRSIIAAQNSDRVSERRLGDPSTRFVVNYVQNQGRELIAAMEGGSKVAYLKQFTRTKKVKATTTPIYDDLYGLVGILCANIDVAAIEGLDDIGRSTFCRDYVRNSGKTPEFERLQWGLDGHD